MATLTSGKIAATVMEAAMETYESQQSMLDYVKKVDVDPATLQNAGNSIMRKVAQHSPSISGWDLTGLETGIIQQMYIASLGTPDNDIVDMRVDDLRDLSYWKERGQRAGAKRASNLNTAIVNSIRTTGSLGYRVSATSGFDFIAQAQATMDKRQSADYERYFALNNTHNFLFGKDLAGRQTLQAQPADTFKTGLLYKNIAGFDIMTSSSISALAGGADPATTVTANVSLAPLGGTVTNTTTLVVTNNDYRSSGSILVTSSASYNVGDIVTFANGGVTVKAVGRDDKTVTDEAMTFRIISKPNGTSIEVWPRPIAADDPALSTLEKAYANINTRILNTATVNRVNTDASTQPSIFWQKDSIEVLTGDVPMQLLSEFSGMKHVTETMRNGLKMHMLYDASLLKAAGQFRLFVYYGVNNARPADNGIAIKI